MIERGEVEMGITSFFANRDRAEVTDFSPVLRVTENKLFIKFPGSVVHSHWSRIIQTVL